MSITFVGASSTRMTRWRSWLNDVMCVSGRAGLAEITDAWDSIDGPGNVYSLRNLARALVASGATSATGVTYEMTPQYRTTLARVGATSAWTTTAGISFRDVEIAIAPVP